MIELILRGVVALTFLLAAVLLPLMVGLTGDPELAAAITAVGTPLAALLLAGTMTEYGRVRAERDALRRWSRLEHPANAPARRPLVEELQPAGPGRAAAIARAEDPLVDPVDEHAADVVALFRIGRHDPEALAAPTAALPVVPTAVA